MSPIWAPSGIALAALLVLGLRAWPAVFAGAVLVNVATTGSLGVSLAIAAGNTLEGVAGAYLVERLARGRRAFERVPDIFRLALLAAAASATLSATVGVTSLGLAGLAPWDAYGPLWLTWWLGDATGVLIIAPLLVLWIDDHDFTQIRRHPVEATVLALAAVLVGVVVFGDSPISTADTQLQFACIPVLLWAAFRFGRREVATGTALFSVIAAWETLPLLGALPGGLDLNQRLLLLQTFLATMALTMLSVATVVWERRRATEALRDSEARYRSLAGAIPQIVFRWTADGQGDYSNQRWFDYTGLAPSQSGGFGWLTAVHPDDVAQYRSAWQQSLASGRPFELEIRLRRADGAYRWHLVRAIPGRGEPVQGTAWVGTCTDIDDVKRLEAERETLLAREREARVRAETTVSTLERLQMVADIDLPGLSVDALLQGLLQRIRTALQSDTATILLLDAEGRMLVPAVSHGLRDQDDHPVPVPLDRGIAGRIAASDEGIIVSDVSASDAVSPFLRERVRSLLGAPLRVDGRLVGIIHVGTIIPHRFTAADLKLLGLVAHRAAQAIERARLHEAERMAREAAEAADRSKDGFLAMVSHELQTPLHVVMLYATLLRSGRLDPPTASRAIDIIEEHARALSRMVVDLLDVSRIITGKLALSFQRVNLPEVVGASIESLRPAAVAKGVSLVAELPPGTRGVRCDPQRVQQIVWNLVSNAIKFTPEAGRVEVTLAEDADRIRIRVADTGQGIAREFLPHVFERFRQADESLTRRQGGLGLGLAIVHHLVERHGGTVQVESEGEGKGSTFTVELPVTVEMAVDEPDPA